MKKMFIAGGITVWFFSTSYAVKAQPIDFQVSNKSVFNSQEVAPITLMPGAPINSSVTLLNIGQGAVEVTSPECYINFFMSFLNDPTLNLQDFLSYPKDCKINLVVYRRDGIQKGFIDTFVLPPNYQPLKIGYLDKTRNLYKTFVGNGFVSTTSNNLRNLEFTLVTPNTGKLVLFNNCNIKTHTQEIFSEYTTIKIPNELKKSCVFYADINNKFAAKFQVIVKEHYE